MGEWNMIETEHFKVMYVDTDDFKVFDRKITYGNKWYKRIPLEERLEKIYDKTRRMLGTKPPKKKIEILVHHNQEHLGATYTDTFLKNNSKIRAWYNYRRNRICVNAKTIANNVLAHEIGHAVTDHHFGQRPPRPMAEIIARYVGGRFR